MALRQEMSGNNSTLIIQEQLAQDSKQPPVNQLVGEISSKEIQPIWPKLDGGASAMIGLGKYKNELVVVKKYRLYDEYVIDNEYKIKNKNPDLVQMSMLKEWEILRASFPSQYVVRPIAYCQKPPQIVMEYMKNGALDYYMATHKLSIKQKFSIANDIALGILRLLEIGVVHRDIKSGNVLIAKDLHAKLCDFDLSRNISSKERMNVVGTPEYVAPEYYYLKKLEGLSLEAADVFSFGVLLFEIFVHRDAFLKYSKYCDHGRRIGRVTILSEIVNEYAQVWPADLKSIIVDCLNVWPDKRPSMHDIQKRLNQLLISGNTDEIDRKNSSISMLSLFSSTCAAPSNVAETKQIGETNICKCAIM